MKISLTKYRIKEDYTVDGEPRFLCEIRKRFIKETREEIVRQRFIKYLLKEIRVPKEMIDVEVHLSKLKIDSRNRADIVIYSSLEPHKTPLVLVECKSEKETIQTDNVLNQALGYNQDIKAKYICLVDGKEYKLYQIKEKSRQEIEFCSYKELLSEQKMKVVKERDWTWKRANYKNLWNKKYLSEWPEKYPPTPTYPVFRYYISDYTFDNDLAMYSDEYYHTRFIIRLLDLLNDISEKNQCPKIKTELYTVIKDGGIRFAKFSTAGCVFKEFYRFLIIEDEKKNDFIISFAIFSYDKYSKDKGDRTYKNEQYKHTYLMVGVDSKDTTHHVLELKLNSSLEIDGDDAKLYHSGVMSRVKQDSVIKRMAKKCPYLIMDNKVYLGKFNLKEDLYFSNTNIRDMIKRLIDYAMLRHNFKNGDSLKEF
jgi:hypothetical protein